MSNALDEGVIKKIIKSLSTKKRMKAIEDKASKELDNIPPINPTRKQINRAITLGKRSASVSKGNMFMSDWPKTPKGLKYMTKMRPDNSSIKEATGKEKRRHKPLNEIAGKGSITPKKILVLKDKAKKNMEFAQEKEQERGLHNSGVRTLYKRAAKDSAKADQAHALFRGNLTAAKEAGKEKRLFKEEFKKRRYSNINRKEEKMSTDNIINSLLENNLDAMRNAIIYVISEKAAQALEERKQMIASTMLVKK